MTRNPEECLKSEWKKEVKAKINKKNEKIIMNKSTSLSKTRTVRNEEWGRRQYIKEGTMDEIAEIMKLRLHMHQLPCNYKTSQENGRQCRFCYLDGCIRTEHYFHCRKINELRTKMGAQEKHLYSQNTSELLKASKYVHAVTLLH